jgi:hypothetical protein
MLTALEVTARKDDATVACSGRWSEHAIEPSTGQDPQVLA